MNIAVTGGSGRLGRVVIETLLAQGHILLNIDRTPPPEDLFAGRAVRFARADLPTWRP